MEKIKIEGHIVQLGKSLYGDDKGEVMISIPHPTVDDPDEADVLTFEASEEQIRYFAAHLFSRVRITLELVPELKIANGGEKEKEEEDEAGEVRGSGDPNRIQDDHEEG